MAVKNNPELGRVKCEACGSDASVHQTQRGKGRFLYTRCGNCGVDQRAGAAVQTRLWNETQWREGLKPEEAPPNLKNDDWKPPTTLTEQPKTEPKPATEKQPAKPATSGGMGVLIVGVVAFAGGAAIWAKLHGKKQQEQTQQKPTGANYESIGGY